MDQCTVTISSAVIRNIPHIVYRFLIEKSHLFMGCQVQEFRWIISRLIVKSDKKKKKNHTLRGLLFMDVCRN